MTTPRAALLALVETLRPDWDADDYGSLLEECAHRGIRPEAVLMQTALALKRGEGVREIRAALAPKPWERR